MKKRNLSEEEVDKLLSRLSASTRGPQDKNTSEKNYSLLEKQFSKPIVKRFPLYRYAAAASVILIVSLSIYLMQLLGSPKMLTISTAQHLKEVTLPDGTTVTLSRYSTLQYPEKFNGETREVILSGEGFFDVSKDKQHPFIVNASEVQIKVLGTQFNVQSYSRDNYIKTTLLEGSVAISNSRNGNTKELLPNESATFYKESGRLTKETENNAIDEALWKSGIIIFNNKPLSIIAGELSNYFNIKINITDKELKNNRLNARFENSESLEEILNLLQSAGNFSWKKQNNTIIISTNH
ncbi:MAG: FecR domain-containing protein [Dysgonomonas sp.]|uniref:FecR family protein n=1 Tax=Dysgonomonas TaxID=156973 RepID=UPI003341E302